MTVTTPPPAVRTTLVPLAITCPTWCTRSADEHAADLWNYEGTCIHLGADVNVTDVEGYHGSLDVPAFHPPVSLFMTATTRPDGVEVTPPMVHLEGSNELSVSQALNLADAIRAMVDRYRAAGGKA